MKTLKKKYGARAYVASAAALTTVLALYALMAPFEDPH